MVDLVITKNINDNFQNYYDLLIPESRLCIIDNNPLIMHKSILKCENIGFDYMGHILILNKEPYQYVNVFKKLGKGIKISKEERMKSALTKEEWRTFFDNLWNIENEEEIYYRLVRMYSLINNQVISDIDVSKWNRINYIIK